MRIDMTERLIAVLTAGTLLLLGALVVAGSFLQLGPSGIPDVAVQAALDTQDWLHALRAHQRRLASRVALSADAEPRVRLASQAPGTGGEERPEGQPGLTAGATVAATAYFDASGAVPATEQAVGLPWLRRQPGVAYAEPRPIPEVLYRKYQSFEDTWNLAREGGGQFVSTGSGETAYQVDWVDPNSYLATRLGLQPGDHVISVNGQPVGASLAAGQGLFEQLKGERRFAVLIEREGRPVVLSFFVN